MIVGNDPGESGGSVILDRGNVMAFYPGLSILDVLNAQNQGNYHFAIESAQAMPKQGVVSMFNYGVSHGKILGAVTALKIPFTMVKPRVWQASMYQGLSGDLEGKERSLEAVYRLYPGALEMFTYGKRRKPDMGLVDALLIAGWLERFLNGGKS